MAKRRMKRGRCRSLTVAACSFQRTRGGDWEVGLWVQEAARIIDMEGKLLTRGVYNYQLAPWAGCLCVPEVTAQ